MKSGKCGKEWKPGAGGKCERNYHRKRSWKTAGLKESDVDELDRFFRKNDSLMRSSFDPLLHSHKAGRWEKPPRAALRLREDSLGFCGCKKCLRRRRRKDSLSLSRFDRWTSECGRGWLPGDGGKCVRKNRGKAFRRALWNTSAALGAVTASSVATRIGAGLVARGVRKVKQFQSQPQSSVRRDAPPRAKCDKDHGWTRGPVGKCIRAERREKFGQGAKAGAITAGILGLTAVGYSAARTKYRANIPKAAELAVQRAKQIDPGTLPDFKGKEGILLAQPGFTGFAGKTQAAGIENIMGTGLSAAAGDGYGTFMLSNQKFNIFMPDKVPEGWDPSDMSTYRPSGRIEQFIGPTIQRFLKTTIKDGYNEQSVEATAHLLAMENKFRQQNPGKEPVIKAAGYSAGGMILADSNMQLKHLGKNVEMLFLGSPYFGLADDSKSMTRIVSSNDPVMKLGSSGYKNVHRFNSVKNHIKYQEDPGVQKVVNDWLQKGVTRPVPGLRANSLAKPPMVRRRRATRL